MLRGGRGERIRERAGNDWKGEERREAPARFLFFRSLLFSKYPAGASAEERVLSLINLMILVVLDRCLGEIYSNNLPTNMLRGRHFE